MDHADKHQKNASLAITLHPSLPLKESPFDVHTFLSFNFGFLCLLKYLETKYATFYENIIIIMYCRDKNPIRHKSKPSE